MTINYHCEFCGADVREVPTCKGDSHGNKRSHALGGLIVAISRKVKLEKDVDLISPLLPFVQSIDSFTGDIVFQFTDKQSFDQESKVHELIFQYYHSDESGGDAWTLRGRLRSLDLAQYILKKVFNQTVTITMDIS